MKKVCASCGIDLGTVSGGRPGEVTHGLCKACSVHFLADMGISLDEYMEGLDVPVVTLTGDKQQVTGANSSARQLLGKEIPEISGLRSGDVFECKHALLPGGCGQTIHCSGCAIRKTVTDTMETGKAHKNVPAFLDHHEDEGSRKIDMLISTEKRGGVVFLSIVRMDEGL